MKRPIRIKIKGIDILPIIMGIIIIILIVLSEEYLTGYFVPLVMMLGGFNYVKKIHNPYGIDLKKLISTDDIRSPSFRYKSFSNQPNSVSFVKFYFTDDTVYMYTRSFFPKIYEGPFTIMSRRRVQPGDFYISEFTKINKYEVKLGIQSFNGTTFYGLLMRGIKEEDFKLIETNFGKMGYDLEIEMKKFGMYS